MNPLSNPAIDDIERQLRILDDRGRCLIQIGLFVTVYFEDAHDRMKKLAVFHFVEDYLQATAQHICLAKGPDSPRWSRFSPTLLPMHREVLLNVEPDSSWHIEYRGGSSDEEASAFSITAFGVSSRMRKKSYLSFLKFTFPLLWFTEHGGSLVNYSLSCCNVLAPSSGYGGIGILQPAERSAAFKTDPLVYAIARRFTALEVDIPIEHSLYLSEGIKGVNWLTMVSSKWLDKIGGLPSLQETLHAPALVHEYSDGVVVQAGLSPVFGDVNRGEKAEYYAAVAKAFAPIRIKSHASFHNIGHGDRFTNESSVKWLQRFDGQ